MSLGKTSTQYLDGLLDSALEAFDGMSERWHDLQPHKLFNIRHSEDFHIGFLFGHIELNFIQWFYSNFGRSMTDDEYKAFWLVCRKRIRKMHEKWDRYYFQE